MKGIVGKKLGMTQVFDEETGSLTPVTVIEAGPCPVVRVRTEEADGYDAVQLAFDEVAARKLTKPELGHLERAGVAPHRRLVEIRGEHELEAGATVTVEAFEPGERVKVSGVSIGKGFQGTIKRHRLPPRPGQPRLAQHPQARLDRCLRLSLPRLQGHEDGRANGCCPRHPARADGRRS